MLIFVKLTLDFKTQILNLEPTLINFTKYELFYNYIIVNT